jgi:hypothetical protein
MIPLDRVFGVADLGENPRFRFNLVGADDGDV